MGEYSRLGVIGDGGGKEDGIVDGETAESGLTAWSEVMTLIEDDHREMACVLGKGDIGGECDGRKEFVGIPLMELCTPGIYEDVFRYDDQDAGPGGTAFLDEVDSKTGFAKGRGKDKKELFVLGGQHLIVYGLAVVGSHRGIRLFVLSPRRGFLKGYDRHIVCCGNLYG